MCKTEKIYRMHGKIAMHKCFLPELPMFHPTPIVPRSPARQRVVASFASRFKAELFKLLAQLAVRH